MSYGCIQISNFETCLLSPNLLCWISHWISLENGEWEKQLPFSCKLTAKMTYYLCLRSLKFFLLLICSNNVTQWHMPQELIQHQLHHLISICTQLMWLRVEFSCQWDITLNEGKLCVHIEYKNEGHTTHSSEVGRTIVLKAPLSAGCFLDGPLLNSPILESDTERRREGQRRGNRNREKS